ncbi:21613_t:CDS:1, partial [Dentiscutata erythropus]
GSEVGGENCGVAERFCPVGTGKRLKKKNRGLSLGKKPSPGHVGQYS